MRAAGRIALVPALLALSTLQAAADTPMTAMVAPELRIGSHPGFGRVVFDFPAPVDYRLTRDGNRVLLAFARPTVITEPGGMPRNVTAIVARDGGVEIDLVHGAQLRPSRLGTRVVLDVIDPPTVSRATTTARAQPAAKPTPAVAATPAQSATSPGTPANLPHAASAAPETRNAAQAAEPIAPPAPAHAFAAASQPSRVADAPARWPQPQSPDPGAPKPGSPEPGVPTSGLPAPGPVLAAVPEPVLAVELPAPGANAAAPPTPAQIAPAQIALTHVASIPAAAPVDPPPAPLSGGPMQLVARLVAMPPGMPGSAAFLPLGPQTGAAAFRRGATGLVVFDERTPLDLAALRGSPLLGNATIQLLAAATLLTVPLPAGTELRLARVTGGWQLTAGPAFAAPRPIAPVLDGATLRFPAEAAAHVVAVPDAGTGQILLVGTQRRAGEGVGVARRSPQFALDASWQGVVVEPLADRVALRSDDTGFVLSAGDQPLDLSAEPNAAQAVADAAHLTRRFDFPDEPTSALMRRMRDAMLSAAQAPAQARAEPRRHGAEAMVALGMGAEAQSLLQLTIEDDPRAATPAVAALGAIAALLAGRTPDSAALDDPALTGTDEIALWRAVRTARLRPGAPDAASIFANVLPLALSYPAALRTRVLPLAAETMAAGGAAPAAQALVASRPDDPTLAYARALLLAEKNDLDGALAGFDALARGRDQRDAARAAEQAIELRLTARRITPVQAATALEAQFLAWRGDERELRLRLRVAELRSKAGQYRPALAMLRETANGWPEQRDALRARMSEVLVALVQDPDPKAISPLDLVTLAGDNADVLPDGTAGEQLAALLADKLAALDLPRRAAPVLRKLVQSAAGGARATYGARLAEVALRDGDPDAARQALLDSQADGVAPELALRRTLLDASVFAHQGRPADASGLLANIDDPAADELRADIAEAGKDWSGAEAALRALVAHRVPAVGDLDDPQQSLLLRYASAVSEAGDAATLRALRERESRRMQAGKLGSMFRLLTAEPVKTVADLPRAAAEASLMRNVPASLQALRSP